MEMAITQEMAIAQEMAVAQEINALSGRKECIFAHAKTERIV